MLARDREEDSAGNGRDQRFTKPSKFKLDPLCDRPKADLEKRLLRHKIKFEMISVDAQKAQEPKIPFFCFEPMMSCGESIQAIFPFVTQATAVICINQIAKKLVVFKMESTPGATKDCGLKHLTLDDNL